VRPKWRTDEEELRRLGYQMPRRYAPKQKGGQRRPHGRASRPQ
jgi:hypothetical protein